MRYGANEYRYARPIADALENDAKFTPWLLRRTRFAAFTDEARLLWNEQKRTRSKSSESWWRSYWAPRSYPYFQECGERETDLLAVFETNEGFRFALHLEVKAPGDRFGFEQAADYRRRADCWKGRERAPRTVVPHDDACTVLCCERRFAMANEASVSLFDHVVVFEELSSVIAPFPDPKEMDERTI